MNSISGEDFERVVLTVLHEWGKNVKEIDYMVYSGRLAEDKFVEKYGIKKLIFHSVHKDEVDPTIVANSTHVIAFPYKQGKETRAIKKAIDRKLKVKIIWI